MRKNLCYTPNTKIELSLRKTGGFAGNVNASVEYGDMTRR